jgi:hypothetical protein
MRLNRLMDGGTASGDGDKARSYGEEYRMCTGNEMLSDRDCQVIHPGGDISTGKVDNYGRSKAWISAIWRAR